MRHIVRLVLFGVGLCCLYAPAAGAVVLINEVLADPPPITGDANGDGIVHPTQDEFVELFNTGTDPVSLGGWSLWDTVGLRRTLPADAAISGQGFFVVFGGLGLNNEGDTVSLFNTVGILQDRLVYGPEGGMDVSLTRFPDGQGPFVPHSLVSNQPFSPGASAAIAVPAQTMPEPSSLLLLGIGLCCLKNRGHFSFFVG